MVSEFYWAVMYQANRRCKPYITRFYRKGRDAHVHKNKSNKDFEGSGFGNWHYSVKRYRFYFKGTEVDAYEHEFTRKQKNTKTK